jgi:hypothetical protein
LTSTEPSGHTASSWLGTVLLEQRGGVGVFDGIDHVVGIAVAAQEVLEPRHVGRLRLADQHRPARAGFDQRHAPQDQRAGDALAQVGFGDQQGAQLLRRHEQRFDVFVGMPVDQGRAAAQLADFGQEFARPLPHDRHHVPRPSRCVTATTPLSSTNMPGPVSPAVKRRVAARELLHAAEACNARNLGVTEDGKGLVKAAAVGAVCCRWPCVQAPCRESTALDDEVRRTGCNTVMRVQSS